LIALWAKRVRPLRDLQILVFGVGKAPRREQFGLPGPSKAWVDGRSQSCDRLSVGHRQFEMGPGRLVEPLAPDVILATGTPSVQGLLSVIRTQGGHQCDPGARPFDLAPVPEGGRARPATVVSNRSEPLDVENEQTVNAYEISSDGVVRPGQGVPQDRPRRPLALRLSDPKETA